MLLTLQDAALFFKLQLALMSYVSQKLNKLPNPAGPQAFGALPAERRVALRDAFLERLDLIQSFADENPAHLPDDELDIVRPWRHLVAGNFYILRELKNCTVFLSTEKSPVAYGVVALTQPFEEVVGRYLPIYVHAVLLPFKNQIVYDGLLSGHNISFGGGIKRMLKETYNKAKQRHGIVKSLPIPQKSGM